MLGIIFLGMIAGWIAGLTMRGSGFGIIADIIIGPGGALIGRTVFRLAITSPHHLGDLIAATVGAVVLVVAVHFLEARR